MAARRTAAAASPVVLSGASGGVVDVAMGDYFYRPANITVAPGEVTVNLTNEGPRRHTFQVRSLDGQRDLASSGSMVRGDTATVTFRVTDPGIYRLYCSIDGHEDQGQVGSLRVTR